MVDVGATHLARLPRIARIAEIAAIAEGLAKLSDGTYALEMV